MKISQFLDEQKNFIKFSNLGYYSAYSSQSITPLWGRFLHASGHQYFSSPATEPWTLVPSQASQKNNVLTTKKIKTTSKFIALLSFVPKLVESSSPPKFNIENAEKHNRFVLENALVHTSRLKLKKVVKIWVSRLSTLPREREREDKKM